MRRYALAITSLAVMVSLVATPSFAATKSITLSPSATNITVNPGIAANRDITLINDGDTPYTVGLSIQPYSIADEQYDPQFTHLPGTTDPTAWLSLSQSSVSLAAHASATVGYTLKVPTTIAPGGYYAVVFAETTSTESGGVAARNRVGNILYITVNGEVTQKGTVQATSAPSFVFGDSVSLATRVTNSGGVHFQTTADFNVSSITGAKAFSAETTRYVLPQTTRLITEQWSPTALVGIYKIDQSATVPSGTQTAPSKWIVVVRPAFVPFLIFALLTLVGIILIIRRVRSTRRRR